MLLHAQQFMPPNDYICDFYWYELLYYKEILSIYWMTLVIPFLCLKLYSLNFAIAHAQKRL